MSYSWLITGSSRGIGLEIVRQLLAVPANVVFAGCRNPESASALTSLEKNRNLHVVKLDVDDESSIHNAAKCVSEVLKDNGLDYLVNNAAVNEGDDTAFDMLIPNLTKTLHSNVVGPALIAQHFLSLLEKSNRKVIVNISTAIGTFGRDGLAGASYCVSKAALNMLTYKQATARKDLIVFALSPGWVKTDMGGETAPIEVHESVSGVLKVIIYATPEHSGNLIDYTGKVLPW